MGRGIRYSDEFKQEAVNQMVIHGYPVLEVSKRLGIFLPAEKRQRARWNSCGWHQKEVDPGYETVA